MIMVINSRPKVRCSSSGWDEIQEHCGHGSFAQVNWRYEYKYRNPKYHENCGDDDDADSVTITGTSQPGSAASSR